MVMPINATTASDQYLNEGDCESFVQCFDNRAYAADVARCRAQWTNCHPFPAPRQECRATV